MISSSAEGYHLLDKWRAENASLHLIYAGDHMGVNSVCVIKNLSPTEIAFAWDSGEVMLSLNGASFEYAEPREAPTTIKARSEAKYVCCWDISLASGDRCALYELRFD